MRTPIAIVLSVVLWNRVPVDAAGIALVILGKQARG
jgi:hypothetical protein